MTRAGLVALVLLDGCFPFPPEAETADALGPEVEGVEQGPLHRPGQPCLVCHGEDYTRGGVVFAVAGTIYRESGDEEGEPDVDVIMTDADGRVFTERTNEAGNFYIEAGEAHPTFPMTVEVDGDGAPVRHMRSAIYREGSCSACHLIAVDEASAGRVVLEGEP